MVSLLTPRSEATAVEMLSSIVLECSYCIILIELLALEKMDTEVIKRKKRVYPESQYGDVYLEIS